MMSCGKTEIAGEAWLSDNPLKVETSWEEEEEEALHKSLNKLGGTGT
jgi:hypothetical protein